MLKIVKSLQCGLAKECPEAIFVHPDFFQDNGTPMCCDQDMIYDRTFVETETTAIFFKDDTNE
tara:strand:- start:318 stop:506 length:189 start_codon:yes stop_codon:yes gene_type:complete